MPVGCRSHGEGREGWKVLVHWRAPLSITKFVHRKDDATYTKTSTQSPTGEPYSYAYSARGRFIHQGFVVSRVVARWQYHTTSASQISLTYLRLFAGGKYFRFSNITQFPLLKYHPHSRVVSLQVGNTSVSLISLAFRFPNITHLPATSLCRWGILPLL